MNWQAIRDEFGALREWTYLNTASFGQVPNRSLRALNAHFAHREELACADFLDWYTRLDQLRASVARLIGAEADDIAFIPTTAAALATVMAGLRLEPGDNVVTLDDEFPNYQYIAAARKVPREGLRDGRFYEAVDERTRLIALSHVNYSTGARVPLREISAFARQRGVPLFVDGTQSVGALRFDVRETPAGVVAVHGYKWLMSPSGAGFMYVSPELRQRLPPGVIGWRSHHAWRSVDDFHTSVPCFKESAEKYEGSGLPYSLLFALQASVDWMLEIGPEAIERRVLELAGKIREVVRELGGVPGDNGSQIATARFPGADAVRLEAELGKHKVVVAARAGHLRIAPHFYNNAEDVERLEAGLRSVLGRK